MSAPFGVARVAMEGVHGHQQIVQDLGPGLNILHGKNGTGKTTLLHILANLFNRDIARFCHIHFNTISVTTLSGSIIVLRQLNTPPRQIEVTIDSNTIELVSQGEMLSRALDQLLRERLGTRSVYLPAFRAILEGTSESRLSFREREEHSAEMTDIIRRLELDQPVERTHAKAIRSNTERSRNESIAAKTIQCRKWFGDFVPIIRYPSLSEVHSEITNELQEGSYELSRTDQQTLSWVFVRVLETLVGDERGQSQEDVSNVLARVRTNLSSLNPGGSGQIEIYNQLAALIDLYGPKLAQGGAKGILSVYDKALSDRALAQAKAFASVRTYVDSVNRFLEGKSLQFEAGAGRRPEFTVVLPDGRSARLSVLSSGERHVSTLLFAATHMASSDSIVLLDEPELSLHVDWQRIILNELMKQVGDRQIIACTHSPEIGADHRRVLKQLGSSPWSPIDVRPGDILTTEAEEP